MFKKQKKGNNAGKADTKKKSKNNVFRLKLGSFVSISIYDLVTWVGIGLCIGLVLICGFQQKWRGFFWSLVALLFFVLIMLGIRAKQHFWDEEEKRPSECPELSLEGSTISFSASTSPQINILIRNRGHATAHNTALQGADYVYRKPFTGRLKLVTNDVWDVFPNLAPGGKATAFTLRTNPLSPKQIKEIRKGKLLFFPLRDWKV